MKRSATPDDTQHLHKKAKYSPEELSALRTRLSTSSEDIDISILDELGGVEQFITLLQETTDCSVATLILDILLYLTKNKSNLKIIATSDVVTQLIEGIAHPELSALYLALIAKLIVENIVFSAMKQRDAIKSLIDTLPNKDTTYILCGMALNTAVCTTIQDTLNLDSFPMQENWPLLFLLANQREYAQKIADKLEAPHIKALFSFEPPTLKPQIYITIMQRVFGVLSLVEYDDSRLTALRTSGWIKKLVDNLREPSYRAALITILSKAIKDPQTLQLLLQWNLNQNYLAKLHNSSNNDIRNQISVLYNRLQNAQSNIHQCTIVHSIPEEDISISTTKLGQGTYGCIFEGKWHGTSIAIKTMNPDCRYAGALDNFKKEAMLHNSLKHPNIVTFYGTYVQANRYGMVLELLPNGDLCNFIKKGLLTPEYRLHYAQNIANGLNYLNSRNVIHCDLKTKNILVDGKQVKIADLGIAERLTTTQELTTGQVQKHGTYSYMSRENVEFGIASKASDIYSYGVILWEMAIGKMPFKGDNDDAVIRKILADEKPGDLQEVKDKVSIPYATLISKCWEKRAEDRPPIAEVCHEVSCLSLSSEGVNKTCQLM